ncbi:hypothetical protein ONZ45_g612 [Pleurotus djamor]|nr:hypothetical protein ONZ45_g612 [Pleurotus djamor]
MNLPVQNLEEAANIASEFIYGLDNLPSEVAHLLQEIKHRDARTLAPSPSPSVNAKSNGAQSNGHLVLPDKIGKAYAELDILADEKIHLANRIVDLFMKTRAKLDIDLNKVRVLQGEIPNISPVPSTPVVKTPNLHVSAKLDRVKTVEQIGTPRPTPVQASEMLLKSALAAEPIPEPATPTPSASAVSNKKRRLAASNSIKLPGRASTPPTPAPAPVPVQNRSRLRQVHPVVVPPKRVDEDDDLDAEVDEEGEEDEEEDADDERLYCFCQKRSYGDMIACDNEGKCPFEWFHLGCVGLKQPTPEKWYCSECSKTNAGPLKGSTGAVAANGRKGRKK